NSGVPKIQGKTAEGDREERQRITQGGRADHPVELDRSGWRRFEGNLARSVCGPRVRDMGCVDGEACHAELCPPTIRYQRQLAEVDPRRADQGPRKID